MSLLDSLADVTFIAQFTSDCANCGTVIEVGEAVGSISGDGYTHAACPELDAAE